MHPAAPKRRRAARERRAVKQSVLFAYMPEGKIPAASMGVTTALSFGDTESEFQSALRGTAVTDSSMFGRIAVTGRDRVDLLHRLSTNSLSGLSEGGVVSTVFVSDKGRTIDRVIVAAREDSLLLITSPGAELFLTHWIEKYTITEDITFDTVTDDTAMVSLIGSQVVSKFISLLPPDTVAGGCTTIRRGETEMFAVYTTEKGIPIAHIMTGREGAAHLAEETTAIPGARWIGASAYEGFRIFRGIPARPGEINDAYNPLECGLRESISFTKGCYIGQEVIARLDTYGKLRRSLAAVRTGELLHGVPLKLLKNGAEAGMLTSLTGSAFGGAYLGLAVLRNDMGAPGDELEADADGRRVPVTVTSFPPGQPG